MANSKSASENLDITKIYILTIASLTIACLVWMMYNYFVGMRYQK